MVACMNHSCTPNAVYEYDAGAGGDLGVEQGHVHGQAAQAHAHAANADADAQVQTVDTEVVPQPQRETRAVDADTAAGSEAGNTLQGSKLQGSVRVVATRHVEDGEELCLSYLKAEELAKTVAGMCWLCADPILTLC